MAIRTGSFQSVFAIDDGTRHFAFSFDISISISIQYCVLLSAIPYALLQDSAKHMHVLCGVQYFVPAWGCQWTCILDII